jgi:hypothetical protein
MTIFGDLIEEAIGGLFFTQKFYYIPINTGGYKKTLDVALNYFSP